MAFIAGIVLGVLFFGGLYLTVQNLAKTEHPSVLMMASLVIRMAILILGLYLVRGDSYLNIPLALMGILLVRIIMVGQVKRKQLADNGEGRG